MTYSHRHREPRHPCVYLLASSRNGTLYVGVTSNLPQRVWQHRQGLGDGFAERYGVHTLVWYEHARDDDERHRPGESDQGMATGMEG